MQFCLLNGIKKTDRPPFLILGIKKDRQLFAHCDQSTVRFSVLSYDVSDFPPLLYLIYQEFLETIFLIEDHHTFSLPYPAILLPDYIAHL